MIKIKIQTSKREELISVTKYVEENIKNRLLHLFVSHTTAGLTINENVDLNLQKNIINFLNKLVKKGVWMHDSIDENGDAHIKSSLIENSAIIPIKDGKMQLGRWQDIFLCEFDGPKKREVLLNFIKN